MTHSVVDVGANDEPFFPAILTVLDGDDVTGLN